MTARCFDALRGAPEAWLLVGCWLVFTLTLFEPAFRFHGDHERDLRFATLLVQHGLWPDATPAIAPTPFELGPLLYLLLAPLVALSPDPFSVRVGFVVAGAVALLLLHGLMRRHVGRPAAAVGLFAACTATFTYEAFSQLWHSTLLALPVVLFWRSADALQRPDAWLGRGIAVVCAMAGVAMQLHASAVVYPLILVGVCVTLRGRLDARRFALGLGVFLAALAPFLITLVGSLSRGALAGARASAHAWEPAGALTVLGFVVDNVHPLWGDTLGPLLTWPLVGLALVGVVPAWRSPFGRLLLLDVALGLALESALLGNQLAHRYLHANLWAVFLLIALGAEQLLGRLKPRAVAVVLGLVGAAVAVEATVTEPPRSAQAGWLNAWEQRAVASVVAEALPLSDDDMERQVHGIYFGEPMGMRHWHALVAPAAPAASPLHLLVMPGDLALAPFGQRVGPRYTVHGYGRDIVVERYLPWLGPLQYGGPQADTLGRRWRRLGPGARGGQTLHTVSTEVTHAGAATLALADGRQQPCRAAATLNGKAVALRPLSTPRYEWVRFLEVALPTPGALVVSLGPCPAPAFVDLF